MGNTKNIELHPFAPYASPTPGEISVIASGIDKPEQFKFEEEFFNELKDCNFNAAVLYCGYGANQLDNIQVSITNANNAGISIIANDSSVSCSVVVCDD